MDPNNKNAICSKANSLMRNGQKEEALELYQKGIELNKDQIFASYEAQKWKANGYTDQVFEISGRAGTGKTTTVKYILQEMGLDPQHDVLFVAFTGKAASQLSKQNVPAITCHSAFYEYKKEYACLKEREFFKFIQF